MKWRIEVGDCRDVLRSMPAGSVHTVVTSPPYFGLRDYGADGQIGLEPSWSHGDGNARGVVLDPFAGAGTTGLVALQHGREFVGIELNADYAAMARERIELAVRLGFRAPQNGSVVHSEQAALFNV